MQRGEVWWARWEAEERPVVVLDETDAPDVRAMFVVAPASVDLRGTAVEIGLGADEGLAHGGVLRVALPIPGRIRCQWVVTLPRDELVARAGALSAEKVVELDAALHAGGLA